MTFTPFAQVGGLAVQAATTYPAGVALINGTQTFLTWTAPNDGQQHRVIVAGLIQVATLEVGGAVSVTFTDPGGTAHTFQLIAASLGVGGHGVTGTPVVVQAGSVVTVTQSSALTSGASVFFGEILGS